MAKKIGEKVHSNFFFHPDPEVFFRDLSTWVASGPPEYRQIFEAFRKNLRAVFWTAGMPFDYVQAEVHQRRFEKLLIAERIRNQPVERGGVPRRTEEEVLEIARTKFRQELSTSEGSGAIIGQILTDLEQSIENADVLTGATEVLRQSEVLIWGAFEVLTSDLFVCLVNHVPALAAMLFKDERTKKRFQLRDPLAILEQFNFDLSQHMGDALIQSCRLDDLESIRIAFDTIFPTASGLRGQLHNDCLWKLYQRRNLIVHRRSIVDSAYIKNTGDALSTGSELLISPLQLETDLVLVRDVGIELIRAIPSAAPAS